MRHLAFPLTLIAVLSCVPGQATEEYDPYKNAQVLWESEASTCFDTNLILSERIGGVPRFVVGGEMTEPIQLTGEKPTIEELESTGERPWVLVFELVVNASGQVDTVVSLKGGYPRMERLVADHLATWTWKPAEVAGKPVCIRYILTFRIEYH